MAYILHPDYHVKGDITCTSSLKTIIEIEESLEEEQIDFIRGTRIGHVLEFSTKFRFCGSLAHYFSLRRIEPHGDRAFWFRIHGKVVRYSIHEFAQVSGLDCGTNTQFDEDRTLYDAHFPNQGFNITNKMLEKAFKKLDYKHPDKIKLALAWLVDSVILGTDSKSVHRVAMSLANSFDRLNDYSWGRVSWELFHHAFNRDFLTRANKRDVEYKYSLNGFSWAFMCWAFEAFPRFGEICAKRYVGQGANSVPRMLRWISTNPTVLQLETVIRAFSVEQPAHMTLDVDEQEAPHYWMTSLVEYDDAQAVLEEYLRTTHEMEDVVADAKSVGSADVPPPVEPHGSTSRVPHGDAIDRIYRALDIVTGQIERMNHRLVDGLQKFGHRMTKMENRFSRVEDKIDHVLYRGSCDAGGRSIRYSPTPDRSATVSGSEMELPRAGKKVNKGKKRANSPSPFDSTVKYVPQEPAVTSGVVRSQQKKVKLEGSSGALPSTPATIQRKSLPIKLGPRVQTMYSNPFSDAVHKT